MDNYPKIFILILTWNNPGDLRECLGHLRKITYPNFEVIVIDNASKSGTTEKVQKDFQKFTFIYNKENSGFTGGNNIGIKYALKKNADFILIMNDDIMVSSNFLEPLVQIACSNINIGIVGPKNYFYDEKDKIFSSGRKVNYWLGRTIELNLESKAEVEAIAGCCFLIRDAVIKKIGYLYEPFFINFEETDFCLRARKAGFKIICEPKSEVWHKVQSTVSKISSLQSYYCYRNKALFMKRNASFYFKYLFYFYYTLYLSFRFVEKLFRGNKEIALSIKNALFDFWRGKLGKKLDKRH